MTISKKDIDEVFPNNPLKEVAFEIRFPFNLRVDKTIHEAQSMLESDYPLIYREALDGEDASSSNIYVFESINREREVKLGEEFLGITFTRYESFEDFSNEVIKLSQNILNLFKIRELTKIGLRYINEIDIENVNFLEINKFVRPRISLHKTESKAPIGFIVEVLFQKENYFLNSRSIFFSTDSQDEKTSYILDIDAYTNTKSTLGELNEILSKLHYEIQLDFLGNITEEYKQKMRKY